MKVRRSSPSVTLGWLKCGSAALFLLLSPAVAVACPLCYEYARQLTTEGVQLDMADRAVLATPARGASRFQIVAVIKGKDRAAAAAALGKIAGKPAGAPQAAAGADPFMFQDYYAEKTPEQVAKEFGPDFAKAAFELEPGAWRGPIQSGYGWHILLVEALEPSRTPAFEEVEPDVKSAWLDQKQREFKRAAYEAMRARYTVVVPAVETVDLSSLRLPQAPIASMNVAPQ